MSRVRFEQDDPGRRPLPARLDPRAAQVTDRSGRRTSGRLAVAARVIGAVLSVLLLAGTGWGWYLGSVAEASINRTDAIPTDGNTGKHTGSEMNLLLVGDDSRADLTPEQLKQLNAGVDSGELNTDTMMLLHVPADGSRASFVSFPRDSYVQIPGHGWDKLNAAFAYGYNSAPRSEPMSERQAAGQRLLVQTISQLTGLQIDHFASVDLLGFFNLSNVVGGVQVNLCQAVRDSYSGAHFPAGVQTISGADALKFVRQRHGLPRGDLDRVVRQQVFIGGVVRKMLSEKVLLDLGKQRQIVDAVAKSLTVDQNLDLMQLAQQMQSVTAGAVDFQTMPILGDAKDNQGRDILRLPDQVTLHQFFAQLSANPKTAPSGQSGQGSQPSPAAPQTVAPSKVKVEVYNGSGTAGLASSTAAALKAAGFTVTNTGNADSQKYTHTEIHYATGDEALANTLAAKIPGATTTQKQDVTPGSVQLVLGSDFKALGQAVAPSSPSPSQDASDTPRTAADTGCIN